MVWGANGQWVRAHNEQSAKAFIAEQNLAAEQRLWADERWSQVAHWIGNLVRRLFRREPKP